MVTLLKDRNLHIAILLSAACHLFFMFSVKPVFSVCHITRHNTSIAFLGGILERVMPGKEKPFTPGYISFENNIDELKPDGPGFINKQPEKEEFLRPLADTGYSNLNIYRKSDIARINFSDLFIKGPAKDRIVIYKPDLDKALVLPSDFNSDFSANVKFRISKYGFVKYAECVISSGFSEIDQAAIRYIREWQFVPDETDNQEGVIRVRFK